MSNLPSKYSWLAEEDAPRHLLKALELYGTSEIVGAKHNPVIMGWAKEVGASSYYLNDETPWCGLFTAVVLKRAERPIAKDPLRALSWAEWGVPTQTPMLGDVLTFTRNGGGHVGFYVFETKDYYGVLGGNQGNCVSISLIAKNRLFKARRPAYKTQPDNIRVILIDGDGTPITTNEA